MDQVKADGLFLDGIYGRGDISAQDGRYPRPHEMSGDHHPEEFN